MIARLGPGGFKDDLDNVNLHYPDSGDDVESVCVLLTRTQIYKRDFNKVRPASTYRPFYLTQELVQVSLHSDVII